MTLDTGEMQHVELHPTGGARRIRSLGNRVLDWDPAVVLLVLAGFVDATLFVWFIIARYWGWDVPTDVTFVPNDGWCLGPGYGLGVHCFGDFSLPAQLAAHRNPWSGLPTRNNYTAGALLVIKFFQALGSLSSSAQLELLAYLTTLTVGLLVPAFWAARGIEWSRKMLILALLGVTSIPVIVSFDRGNSVGFIAPVLLGLFVAMARGWERRTIALLVLATLVKPQFGLLVFVLLARRQYKQLAVAIVAILVTNFLAFLAWPSAFPQSIKVAYTTIMHYNGVQAVSAVWPTNLSFAHGIAVIDGAFRWLLGLSPGAPFANASGAVAADCFILLAGALIVVLGRRIPLAITIALLGSLASFGPTVSYSYYCVFAVPVGAALVHDHFGPHRSVGFVDARGLPPRLTRVACLCMAIAIALTVSRSIFPRFPGEVGAPGLPITTAELVPLVWALTIVVVIVAAVRDRLWASSCDTRAVSSAEPELLPV